MTQLLSDSVHVKPAASISSINIAKDRPANVRSPFSLKIGEVIYGPLLNLVKYGTGFWHKRALTRAYHEARLTLGARMYEAGIDDGELGGRLSDVDERLCYGEVDDAAGRELQNERQRLLVQLADLALEDDAPLPGADAEYQAARALKRELGD